MKSKSPLSPLLRKWSAYWQPSEPIVSGVLGMLVGIASGAGVWLFKEMIELMHFASTEGAGGLLAPLGGWSAALLPVLGGLLVGVIMQRLVGPERHHGVAGIIESAALGGGRLRYWRIPAKTLGAALAIGSGASVGPEDPSVQIGANLGSLIGQRLRLSDERMRILLAAGAAAGVAAAFNAPIAGVFFAVEIILGEMSVSSLGVVVLASVASAVFTQAVSGPQPAFRVPAYAFNSAWELPGYFGLGLLAGPLAVIYIRFIYIAQDFFHGLRLPVWLKPALAGVVVGIAGLALPQVLGVGYESIESVLNSSGWAVGLLLALLVAKLILTPVSVGAGFPGGVFAPALFIGAMLGAAYGEIAQWLLPEMQFPATSYAMVGMAAVLAGAIHAPITAILLLFEMTNDYHIILPLMFAVIVSMFVSQMLSGDSVYTKALARKGIRLERGRDVEVLETVTVGEIMQPAPFTLPAENSLAEASEMFLHSHHHGAPVVNAAGQLVGILTLSDLNRNEPDTWSQRSVESACTQELVVAYPDEPIGAALRRMGARDIGRLPVVARGNPQQLVGLLRRADLLRAYDAALTRHAARRHRQNQVRLGLLGGVDVHAVNVQAEAACAGKQISQVAWPRQAMIAAVRRQSQTVIPKGNTRLRVGDVLLVVAEPGTLEEVRALCSPPEAAEPGTPDAGLPGEPQA